MPCHAPPPPSIDEVDSAMKTSIKLCEYDDILSARNIYSLLCLTSWKNGYYSVCSKAFVKVGIPILLASTTLALLLQ